MFDIASLLASQMLLRYFCIIPAAYSVLYHVAGDEKLCDIEGLHCLAKHKDELYKLQDKDGKKLSCGCYPLCDDVNYVLQSNALQEWFLGTNLQWGMVTYPRMRYRRDIIFGFTDVLGNEKENSFSVDTNCPIRFIIFYVAVGGMAGLFLGCSVLSFMEIVYFLSLRLFCYAHTSK